MTTNYLNIIACIAVLFILYYVFRFITSIMSYIVYAIVLIGIGYGFYRYITSQSKEQTLMPSQNEWVSLGIIVVLIIIYFWIGVVNIFLTGAIFFSIIYLAYQMFLDIQHRRQEWYKSTSASPTVMKSYEESKPNYLS